MSEALPSEVAFLGCVIVLYLGPGLAWGFLDAAACLFAHDHALAFSIPLVVATSLPGPSIFEKGKQLSKDLSAIAGSLDTSQHWQKKLCVCCIRTGDERALADVLSSMSPYAEIHKILACPMLAADAHLLFNCAGRSRIRLGPGYAHLA